MLLRLSFLVALLVSLAACASPPTEVLAPVDRTEDGPMGGVASSDVEAGVRATLAAQVTAWNEGSIRGFMDGYARTDTLMFLSGGNMRRGWEESYYAYVRGYPDREAMGQLSFEEIEIRTLSPKHALAFGRWRLTRTGDAAEGGPTGLFSLILQYTEDGWLVVHDHTSSN